MGIKAKLIEVDDHGKRYQALEFVCPGCQADQASGVHILTVNTDLVSPSWSFDGNLEAPTVEPSILTRTHDGMVCHSFLRNGVFEFLDDCTHELAGQKVPIPDLPAWCLDD